MSEPVIEANKVRLVYPVYTIRAQSLRNTVLNLAVGGRLLQKDDVVMVNALDGVSFTLEEGDRLGILGHNGSGKTTLLKVLAGIYEPDSGEVRARGKISSMLDIALGSDPDATGVQNILMMARMKGVKSKDLKSRVDEIVEFSELGSYAQLPMKTYSAGMQARLMFGIATNFDPDILIMDEWLGAGDAGFMSKAADRMNSFVNRSRVVVIATHSRGLLETVCNKAMVLSHGRIAYFGPVEGIPEQFPT